MHNRWVGLAVLALPCLVYSMDLTLLDLAVPRIVAELRPSRTELLWILDVYGFVLAGALITMGRLGDRFGRRRVLIAGATAFTIASLLATLAHSVPMLIVSRAIMGLGGATLAPSTLGLIRTMFPDERERGVAIGIWAASFSTGAALGPPLGGLVLEHLPWSSIFLLAVPGMILLVALGRTVLPESREGSPTTIDIVSAFLGVGATLLVIFGVKVCASAGWTPTALLAIALGIASGRLFVRRQRRIAHPLIDLALFERPLFVVAVVAYSLTVFVAFGTYFQLAQYLQLVLHLSPFFAGMCLLPASGGFIVGSLLAPQITKRVSRRRVIASGLLLSAAGFILLSGPRDVAGIAVGSAIMALGLAPVSTLATTIVVEAAPADRTGVATAISETAAELGGALGIALLGSLATSLSRVSGFDPHAFAVTLLVAAGILVATAWFVTHTLRSVRVP